MNPRDQMDGGEVWGPLSRDSEALDTALAEAAMVLARAARAAMWQTAKEPYPINSALAEVLFGLSTAVDGLHEDRQEG